MNFHASESWGSLHCSYFLSIARVSILRNWKTKHNSLVFGWRRKKSLSSQILRMKRFQTILVDHRCNPTSFAKVYQSDSQASVAMSVMGQFVKNRPFCLPIDMLNVIID